MLQNGPHVAMQWIINSLPDVFEDDATAWDGTESAEAWFDRVEAADRAAEANAAPAPAQSPSPAPREGSAASTGPDTALPDEPHASLLEAAWGVIANAGWDDCAKTTGWQEAAGRWRDGYHRWLDLHLRPGGYQTWEELASGLVRERDAIFAEVTALRSALRDAAEAGPVVAAALDCESLRELIMAAVMRKDGPSPGERIADALWPLLEHAQSALSDNEGIRLWMLDCGELVAKHRARAEAAEAKLATLAVHNRGHLELAGSCCPHLAQENLAVIGSEEESGND